VIPFLKAHEATYRMKKHSGNDRLLHKHEEGKMMSDIKVTNKSFENVVKFKYLGMQ
jgi:hypothetical protein